MLGPPPLALCMQRAYEHIRADSRLGFIFVRAATAYIVNAARVRPSSGGFAFGFEFCWGRDRLHCAPLRLSLLLSLSLRLFVPVLVPVSLPFRALYRFKYFAVFFVCSV